MQNYFAKTNLTPLISLGKIFNHFQHGPAVKIVIKLKGICYMLQSCSCANSGTADSNKPCLWDARAAPHQSSFCERHSAWGKWAMDLQTAASWHSFTPAKNPTSSIPHPLPQSCRRTGVTVAGNYQVLLLHYSEQQFSKLACDINHLKNRRINLKEAISKLFLSRCLWEDKLGNHFSIAHL